MVVIFYSRQILNEHCLFVQSYSIDLFMVLQCNMMQTAWTVHSFVKTGIQFLKKGNFWLNLGILNFNNIHVHVIGFGKDIIVLFRHNHLQFHQFSYFCSFFGFSLILTKYIGGIYLTISDFLQTLKHRNFTFYLKGHENQRVWISCYLLMFF